MAEIIIKRTPRGYKFTLPVAPCDAAISGMKNPMFGIAYHDATPTREAYRTFPADKLDSVLGLLRYWFCDAPGGIGEYNRNGGKRLTVRVEQMDETETTLPMAA